MSLTIGSLCTGYGGLDAAVSQHYDARTVWLSEVDKNANQILTHHYPDVPNLGDLTVIDWDTVPKVDILTAGYPCQPFSQAGKRKGTADARHLWPHIARAVDVLRPRICVFENVQGHLSKGGVEVVGSLTSMGYSVRWGLVRASDAGAPHRRARVFIVAVDRDTDSAVISYRAQRRAGIRPHFRKGAEPGGTGALTSDTDKQLFDGGRDAGQAGGGESTAGGITTADTGSKRHGQGEDARTVGRLDGADESEAWERERSREEPGHRSATATADAHEQGPQGRGVVGSGRASERATRSHSVGFGPAGTATPDPDSRGHARREVCAEDDHRCDETGGIQGGEPQPHLRERSGESVSFGPYEAAIRRWEHTIHRPAPQPTIPTGRNGGHRLNPQFVEWMMGLPEGWVTDTGISHVAQLKALGNGVVPQQALLALQHLTNGDH